MADECCRFNLKSAFDTARRLASDPSRVTDSVKQERLATCGDCEHFNKPTKQCKLCGCFMELKTSYSNMKCPKGYWTEED